MTFLEYLEDRISFLLFCLLFLCSQSLLLYFLGNEVSMILILVFLWMLIYSLHLWWEYRRKHKRFQHIEYIKDQLDQKYLLYEVLPKQGTHEEQFYKNLLYVGNKSMIEQVSLIRRERNEYQEYIEQWVHEIKTPIAAMKLWSENQQVERKRDLQQQLERTEKYVEQALYYARSEKVSKDLHIHKVNLNDCILESIQKNKYLCMTSGVSIDVTQSDMDVYSDEKWIVFILDQLIENAVKYRKDKESYIKIEMREGQQHILLSVYDNGKGICTQDIARVFEKGFTGHNGRTANKHSTGIGLYLCKRLCLALSANIKIESIEGDYTKVLLEFKKESYNTVISS